MGTSTNTPPRRERNDGNSNRPIRPASRKRGTDIPSRRERDEFSNDTSTRPMSRRKVASGNSKKIQVLRQKVHAYKVVLISVVILYVVTIFGGIGLTTKGSLEADKYRKELDSVKSELNDCKSDYEDSSDYIGELSSTIKSQDAKIEEYNGKVKDYKGQIASLKETNKKYKKKIKKYKAIINATPTPLPTPTPTPVPELSLEYRNALEKARSYSKHLHLSKQRMYEQLTSEYGGGFPPDAAQYAVDTLFG